MEEACGYCEVERIRNKGEHEKFCTKLSSYSGREGEID